MKTLLAFLLIFSGLSLAALPNYTTVWEARTTGNDTNGAGYVTGSSGTDMSQFDNKNAGGCTSCQSSSANLSVTDVVGNGTTTITSVTAVWSSAIVGNVIYLQGGTGSLAAGWYQAVTFTSGTAIVLDRAVAAGTGITENVGGALATVNKISANMGLAAGSGAWVKAGTGYTTASMIDVAAGAGNTGPSFLNGYTTTRGDNGQATITALAGLSGGNNFIFRYSGSPYAILLSNFIVDCANRPFTRGINLSQAFEILKNIQVRNCADQAINISQNGSKGYEISSINTPSTTSGGSSSSDAWLIGNADFTCINCQVIGNAFNNAVAIDGLCGGQYINLILANFSGTNTDAMRCGVLEGTGLIIINATIYGFTRDAIQFSEGTGIDFRPMLLRNIIISNIGRYCLNQTNTALPILAGYQFSDHIACNTTGATGFYNNWAAGPGDITLTSSPFVAGASNNFALSPGATTIGAGYPGVLAIGGTGHIDMGALQSTATSGSSTKISGFTQ